MDLCSVAVKRLQADIVSRHGAAIKSFQQQYKKVLKENMEKWKRDLQDSNTPKKQKEAALQSVPILYVLHTLSDIRALLANNYLHHM